MKVVRAEIRCCCDPGRLLGTVLVNESVLAAGKTVRFALEHFGERSPYFDDCGQKEEIELPIGRWSQTSTSYDTEQQSEVWKHEGGVAIKSNDTPLETLRRIPGFTEADA